MKRNYEHTSQGNPSESQGHSGKPKDGSDEQLEKEGSIRKANDTAGSFDDGYEIEQEDEINREEARTEDENS